MFLNQNFNTEKYIVSLTCICCGKQLNFKEEMFNYGLCDKCFKQGINTQNDLTNK